MLNSIETIAVAAQTAGTGDEAKLIGVLKSNEAKRKDKADACRILAQIGTKEAVAPLAALLADADLNHMARYGLETIADPSVDVAFRDALGKLKGLQLVGVIGSIGVRRDAKATDALVKLLKDPDDDVAQAAARALGKIATVPAAEAIGEALKSVSPKNKLAFCEGLFRCAEAFSAQTMKKEAMDVYKQLRSVTEPHQVRAGALRGAAMTCPVQRLPLLLEAVRGDDFVLVAAAARTIQELNDADVNKAIAEELPHLSQNKQTVLKQSISCCK